MEAKDSSASHPLQFSPVPPPPSTAAAPGTGAPSPASIQLSFDSTGQVKPAGPAFLGPPASTASGGQPPSNAEELIKKKRGRPRKYADGGMGLALGPASSAGGYSGSPATDPAVKRRSRPSGGSAKSRQFDALGTWGIGFTPHVLAVKAGEDVANKVFAFSQQGPRTVCVLSANGAVSSVTLRQPATSGGLVSYEGRFEIISLSGSFLLAEDGDTRSRTGGLSVALAGSDGRILGGCVAGMLLALTPVQVVIASFIAEGKKTNPGVPRREPVSAPPPAATPPSFRPPPPQGFVGGANPSHLPMVRPATPPSDNTSSDSSEDSGSPVDNSGHAFGHTVPLTHPMFGGQGAWPAFAPHKNGHEPDRS